MNSNLINKFKLLLSKIKQDLDNSINKKEETVNQFRISAIKKVIDILESYPTEIKQGSELAEIKGIGKSTISRIDEILTTGTLDELGKYDSTDKNNDYIQELEKVFGIGRKKALELIRKYNIKSIKELQKQKDKLDLPHAVKVGLKYVDIYQQNIPRSEMLEIDNFLIGNLKNVDPDLYGIICGSYRRQKLHSNDIDLLIVHPKIITKSDLQMSFLHKKTHLLIKLIKYLIKKKFIIDTLTGIDVESKFMGYCKLGEYPLRRIDIRFMPYESYYTSILYFTGSGEFNKRMRSLAIDLGYKLSEFGLFDTKKNKMVSIESEQDIFLKLGMEYVEPKDRI